MSEDKKESPYTGKGKGSNPASWEGLKKGRRKFTKDDPWTKAQAQKGGAALAHNFRAEQKLKENLEEFVAAITDDSTMKDFIKKPTEARNQLQRIMVMAASDKRTALALVQWLMDRVLGKPKQVTDVDLGINESSRPVIQFVRTGDDGEETETLDAD